jgi:hypothetical protein
MRLILTFDVPGAINTAAYGINAAGVIVGGCLTGGSYSAFIRRANGTTTTFNFAVATTLAWGVNQSGVVVGDYSIRKGSGRYDGFVRDTNGNLTSFAFPGSSTTIPIAINDAGEIAGFYLDTSDVPHGFLCETIASCTTIDVPNGTFTRILGLNGAGDISGSFLDAKGSPHGFIASASDAPAPNISSASPSATAGGAAFNLYVNGSGFLAGSTVQWNGTALSTNFVSGTQLTATVPASLIANQGTASITVSQGGTTSNAVTFVIKAPSGGALSIITASPLPAGAVGVPYSQALAATGGITPYKGLAISAGSQLPPGISLNNIGSFLTGLLNGVPTTPGTFTFTAQVTAQTPWPRSSSA